MKLKSREWIYIIVIVVLVQFFVQVSAWLYSGNSGALNYISFAGTLISIILAVLAIIYSYVQSVSQTNTSLNITKQVDSLILATKNIDLSKSQLLNTLDQLNGISEKIDRSIGHQERIDGKVDEIFSRVNSSFVAVEQIQGGANGEPQKNDLFSKLKVFESFLDASNVGVTAVLIYLYYGQRLGFTEDQIKDELAIPFAKVFLMMSTNDFLLIINGLM